MEGSRSLGIYAKSLHGIYAKSLHADGEYPRLRPGLPSFDQERILSARKKRYDLLRHAQRVLHKPDAEHYKDQHRTVWCHRGVNGAAGVVQVQKRIDGLGARLSGVIQCGSVWACPVCSGRVSEVRRRALEDAALVHGRRGGGLYLMTLTFPHEYGDSLSDLFERFGDALTKFKNSRTYKRVMTAWQRSGSVRSLEVTAGPNGWHPHTHDLIFAGKGQLPEGIDKMSPELYVGDAAEMRNEWIRALKKAGLDGGRPDAWLIKRSFQIQAGDAAAEYIAKFGRDVTGWGVTKEMTGQASKIGGVSVHGDVHATPFQLLEWAANGDGKAAMQFREFVDATAGKRMISWTPGLKKSLGLEDELTDAEILEREEENPKPDEASVGVINAEQLKVLVRSNKIGEFLEWVSVFAFTQHDIDEWFLVMARTPQQWGGTLLIKRAFGGGYAVA